MSYTLHCDDCLEIMPTLEAGSTDSIVTDPPYGLSFMGKNWDHGVPSVPFWEAALRVAKPGAFLLAFGGTRTFHRLTCAIEDAGWEIRDCIMWVYGSGFPKSMAIDKAIDAKLGKSEERAVLAPNPYSSTGRKPGILQMGGDNKRPIMEQRMIDQGIDRAPLTVPATPEAAQWEGWGTTIKPAWEPIIVAMKPLDGTFANNALVHGVAGLNIDGCRVGTAGDLNPGDYDDTRRSAPKFSGIMNNGKVGQFRSRTGAVPNGRWPANVIHDGSDEVLVEFAKAGESISRSGGLSNKRSGGIMGKKVNEYRPRTGHDDTGSVARFFYCAKASSSERGGNRHPTVKPLALMRYLMRLTATPAGGTVLDPFMGSGSTGVAAIQEGRRFVGIEKDIGYFEIAQKRISEATRQPALLEVLA